MREEPRWGAARDPTAGWGSRLAEAAPRPRGSTEPGSASQIVLLSGSWSTWRPPLICFTCGASPPRHYARSIRRGLQPGLIPLSARPRDDHLVVIWRRPAPLSPLRAVGYSVGARDADRPRGRGPWLRAGAGLRRPGAGAESWGRSEGARLRTGGTTRTQRGRGIPVVGAACGHSTVVAPFSLAATCWRKTPNPLRAGHRPAEAGGSASAPQLHRSAMSSRLAPNDSRCSREHARGVGDR